MNLMNTPDVCGFIDTSTEKGRYVKSIISDELITLDPDLKVKNFKPNS